MCLLSARINNLRTCRKDHRLQYHEPSLSIHNTGWQLKYSYTCIILVPADIYFTAVKHILLASLRGTVHILILGLHECFSHNNLLRSRKHTHLLLFTGFFRPPVTNGEQFFHVDFLLSSYNRIAVIHTVRHSCPGNTLHS